MFDSSDALRLRATWLYYSNGRTQREIAERWGVSRTTVIRLLEEARQRNEIKFWIEEAEERCVEQRGGELAHAASDVFGEDAVVDDTSRDKTIGGGTFSYVPIEREGSARLDDCTPHSVGHPLAVDDPVLVGGVFGGELTTPFGDAKVRQWC